MRDFDTNNIIDKKHVTNCTLIGVTAYCTGTLYAFALQPIMTFQGKNFFSAFTASAIKNLKFSKFATAEVKGAHGEEHTAHEHQSKATIAQQTLHTTGLICLSAAIETAVTVKNATGRRSFLFGKSLIGTTGFFAQLSYIDSRIKCYQDMGYKDRHALVTAAFEGGSIISAASHLFQAPFIRADMIIKSQPQMTLFSAAKQATKQTVRDGAAKTLILQVGLPHFFGRMLVLATTGIVANSLNEHHSDSPDIKP